MTEHIKGIDAYLRETQRIIDEISREKLDHFSQLMYREEGGRGSHGERFSRRGLFVHLRTRGKFDERICRAYPHPQPVSPVLQ